MIIEYFIIFNSDEVELYNAKQLAEKALLLKEKEREREVAEEAKQRALAAVPSQTYVCCNYSMKRYE